MNPEPRQDIRNDRVESYVISVLKKRGYITNTADENKYLDSRIAAYKDRVTNANGGVEVTDAGELKDLAAQGKLGNNGSALLVKDPNTGLLVLVEIEELDLVEIGDADVGGATVAAAGDLGSSLGRRLFGDNKVAGALSGAVLGEISKQVAAEILSAVGNSSQTVESVANRTFQDFGIDIAGAGAGAVTSYLVGEVFSELGINGFAGEALNSAASFALSTIASNLTKQALGQSISWNSGLSGASFANFAGSFLGSKLASFVKSFDTVGGQIGFSVGGAALVASIFANSAGIVANFLAPGVGAFVGALLGGIIGSIFGGTPESGAHVIWDAASGTFTTGTSWADDWGGSSANQQARDRAIDVATTASDVLNRVVDGLGDSASAYQNPTAIGAGAYGQRANKWLYWGAGENSRNHYLSGEYDNAINAINHGLRVAFDNVALQGGDIYLKRALYRNLASNTSRADFDFSSLIGDLSIGADLSFYHENRALIDASIVLAPESALAQDWVLTLIRAGELNLDDHYRSDLFGGLQGYLTGSNFLKDTGLNLADIDVQFSGGALTIGDGSGDQRFTETISNFASTMGYYAVTTSTSRTGTIYSDIIVATGSGNINIYDNSSSTATNGPGMAGYSRLSDDIFIGNNGNNYIYGYAGWDWLEGKAGADRLYGGNGNDFLSGGDGNDYLYGENDDDVLVGGVGTDYLYGQNGDDTFLVDQDSNWDYLHGGAGNDTVSFENFDTAVTADMRTGAGSGYTTRIYGDGWLQVENLTGSKYSDTLQGNNSANVLTGLSGDDTINGHGGNDMIIGGAGADTINGGSGTDTVSYRESNRGVRISLLNGTARGGDASGDLITSIENVEGSNQADVLQGGTAAGQLLGLDGSDLFLGSSGATQFFGGDGINTVDYSDSTGRVYARLDTGIGYYNWANGDRYDSVEQLIGSNYNDTLYGSGESDRLQGGAGSDYLYGQAGDDSYAFTVGSGLDRITDSGGYQDYIIIDDGISLNDLHISRSGSTLVLQRLGSADKIYVNSHFATLDNKIDQIAWENGSRTYISQATNFYNGGGSSETLYGSAGNDFVHGHSGNDTIHGFNGFNMLIGGAGTDTLYGGAHSDYYVFGRGSGIDTINDSGGSDTLVMADDISANDLLIEYQGSDLYIGLKVDGNPNVTAFNAPDRVVIKNQLNGNKAVEQLQLSDQRISLPKLVGQATGSNNAPQMTTSSSTIYAPFYGGAVAFVGTYDTEGDALTLSVNSASSYDYAPTSFSFVNGNHLYTSQYWNRQEWGVSVVNISISDGQNTTNGDFTVNWRPDLNGGPLWPIVLDLDGDGIELVNPRKSNIRWDVNEDGYIDKIGWAGPDDAFLAIDRDGSGLIEGVDEISFINDLEGATTDFEGLRGFDFDADGVSDGRLDENDVFYSDFRIWQDANQDGLSDASELKTLAEAGIDYINLAGDPTGKEVKNTYHPSIYPNLPEFGDFCVTGDGSSDGAQTCFEE